MQIKEMLIGLPLLMFVVWIFAAPLPQERIERACSPIEWVGNLATSTTALTKEDSAATAGRWSDKLNYSCKYMIWRLFYQKQYIEAVEKGLIKPLNAKDGAVINKQESISEPEDKETRHPGNVNEEKEAKDSYAQ